MPFRIATIFYSSLALAYSALLFFIASFLQQWTKMASAALTWVVYARLVNLLVIFLATAIAFITFIKFPLIRKKWLFLAVCTLFAALTWHFVSLLEGSVNEYVHFPEYATLVLLWHTALKTWEPRRMPAFIRERKTWIAAIAVSAVLGILEESYQFILPNRIFDFQDILLNFMGVWLGGLMIWILES